MPAEIATIETNYFGRSFQGALGYIRRNKFSAPAAASATSIVNAHSADGSTLTTDFTQPDVARTLQYVASTTGTGNVTVNGTDKRGNAISETKALNNTSVVHGQKAFATITSVVLPSGAYNVSVGIDTGLGLDRVNTEDCHLFETVDGAQEAVSSFSFGTSLSSNYFVPTTAPNGTHNYVLAFVATEVRND